MRKKKMIDTPERKQLREEIYRKFISRGSARKVHQESREILNNEVKEFTEGDMKGCNVIIQTKKMQMVGLEPTCSCLRQILSLLRLPFRHIC